MSLFSARTLATLRRIEQIGFDKRATILRRAETRDSGGGTVDTFTAVASHVPCRKIIAGSEDELVISARESEVLTWRVYLPWRTDLLATDRILLDGDTLEVKGANWGQSDATTLQALCIKIEGETDLGLQLNAGSIAALNTERAAHSLPALTSPPVGSDVDATIALFAADLAAAGSGGDPLTLIGNGSALSDGFYLLFTTFGGSNSTSCQVQTQGGHIVATSDVGGGG